jgi:hypothetical protein
MIKLRLVKFLDVGGVADILEVLYVSTFRDKACNMDEFVCVYDGRSLVHHLG